MKNNYSHLSKKKRTIKHKIILSIVISILSITSIILYMIFNNLWNIILFSYVFTVFIILISFYILIPCNKIKAVVYIAYNPKANFQENFNNIIAQMNKIENLYKFNYNFIQYKFYSITDESELQDKTLITYVNEFGEVVKDKIIEE